jgi:hypothetical protein
MYMPDPEKNNLLQNGGEEKKDIPNDSDSIAESYKQAEKDLKQDLDLTPIPDPADDLDEGELARFEDEE